MAAWCLAFFCASGLAGPATTRPESKPAPELKKISDKRQAETTPVAKSPLEEENTQLRERLIKALEELYNASPKTRRPEILLSLLNDPINDVRLLGATLTDKWIAANEKVPAELRQCVRAMLLDSDPRLRQSAAMLEAGLADRKTTALLLERLRDEKLPAVRIGLLKALGRLKSPDAIPALIAEIRDRPGGQATAAAEAMGLIVAEKPMSGRLKKKASEVLIGRYEKAAGRKEAAGLREALLTAMGILGDPSATLVLKKALKDQAGTIRLAGVAGLSKLRAKQAAGAIEPLVRDSDRGVRQAAVAALVRLGGAGYLKIILQRTDPHVEPDQAVRKEAVAGVLDICKNVDAKTLGQILKFLPDRKNPNGLRIPILRLYVSALKAEKSADLQLALRSLGLALHEAGRIDEAVAPLAEAYEILRAHPQRDSSTVQHVLQAVWFEYLTILLSANDVTFAKVLADRPGKDEFNSFQNGLALLNQRLATLENEKNYLPAIALLTAALEQLDSRLSAEQSKPLTAAMVRAAAGQLALDRKQAAKLLGQLLSDDAADRTKATAALTAMGDRARLPLLEQLIKAVAAKPPNTRAESAIIEMLKIFPDMGQYDPQAEPASRLEWVKARIKKYSGGTGL